LKILKNQINFKENFHNHNSYYFQKTIYVSPEPLSNPHLTNTNIIQPSNFSET